MLETGETILVARDSAKTKMSIAHEQKMRKTISVLIGHTQAKAERNDKCPRITDSRGTAKQRKRQSKYSS